MITSIAASFNYKEYAPAKRIQHIVSCYWTFTGPKLDQEYHHRIPPSGCVELVVQLGDQYYNRKGFLEPRIALFGPGGISSVVQPLGLSKLVAIRFKPSGFFIFSGIPVNELTDQILAGPEISNWFPHWLFDSISDLNLDQIPKVLDAFLQVNYMNFKMDNRISHVVECIEENRGEVKITDLPNLVNLSQRQFEFNFRKHVGLSAKTFARIVRFNHTMRKLLYSSSTHMSGAELFYDQSHFIKDFKSITGLSPTEFQKRHQGNFIFR